MEFKKKAMTENELNTCPHHFNNVIKTPKGVPFCQECEEYLISSEEDEND